MTADALPDWEGVRAAWLGRKDLSVAEIAILYGLTTRMVSYRAKVEGWGDRPADAPVFGTGRKKRSANVTREQLVQRIYNVLAQELTLVEERMGDILAEAGSGGEKAASGVADVIGNLQKLKTEANAKRRQTRPAKEPERAPAGDLNAVRKDLARRVARLRRQWEHGVDRKPTDG